LEKIGLVPGHAYTLISAHHEDEHKILKLRNPWGKFEWKGDYSDNSDQWTEELKQKVGWTDEDDGIFFMSVKDFKACFNFFCIGIRNDQWFYNTCAATNEPNHSSYFKVVVSDYCSTFFRVHFRDSRYFQGEYSYPECEFEVSVANQDGTFAITEPDIGEQHKGQRSVFPVSYYELILEPGEYILRVKALWNEQMHTHREYVLSAFSE